MTAILLAIFGTVAFSAFFSAAETSLTASSSAKIHTLARQGDVRARSPEDRESIKALMGQMVEGIATAHGVTADFSFNTEFIETINAPGATEAVVRASKKAALDTIPDRQPMSFSEDFAHFSAAVPGCFVLLGNGENGAHGQPLHSNDYDFNDDLLPMGVALWTEIVRDRLPQRTEV